MKCSNEPPTTDISFSVQNEVPVTPSARATFRDLCSSFCCLPPFCPLITPKLAFKPPEPSYRILTSDTGQKSVELNERLVGSNWPHGVEELKNIDAFLTRTSRGNKIACMFINPIAVGPSAWYTLLFSHGNNVDIGQMCSFYLGLGYRLGCNVFAYDYSGYGQSSGRPSEKNLYADIAAALKALETRYQIPPERVFLYGQGIGTVPSFNLASTNFGVAGLLLHSPLPDIHHGIQRNSCSFDAFPSMKKKKTPLRPMCPTLAIYGTEDDVLDDFSHKVEPFWLTGTDHNDLEVFAPYIDRLRTFIYVEAMSQI